jgi:integrase
VSRRMIIGKADRLSVDQARKLACRYLSEVDHGRDPMEERRAQERASKTTFRAVADAYLEDLSAGGKRSVEKYRSYLQRLILPELGAWQVADVRRSHVRGLVRRLARDSGPGAADLCLAIIRGVLNAYALDADNYRPPSFKDLKQTPVEDRARTRALTDDELRAVWNAALSFPTPWGPFVRFLLLTACRRTEAASATWSEIADSVWTIRAARYKTKTEVRLPLSDAVRVLLQELPRFDGCPFIFTPDGRHAITGFSDFKVKFDAACRVAGWRLHDLRRTSRTLLSRAGVLPDVAERCLGHKISGIRGVYDRHSFENEMRHAFEALAAQIKRIVNPQANVVAFGGADRARGPQT